MSLIHSWKCFVFLSFCNIQKNRSMLIHFKYTNKGLDTKCSPAAIMNSCRSAAVPYSAVCSSQHPAGTRARSEAVSQHRHLQPWLSQNAPSLQLHQPGLNHSLLLLLREENCPASEQSSPWTREGPSSLMNLCSRYIHPIIQKHRSHYLETIVGKTM